jgi:hypothetical protein
MPVRETASDGVPVGKKPQTGIEVKKSVGLPVHANNSQRRRALGISRERTKNQAARSQVKIQITFYLAAWPQQEPEVKN